MRTKMTAGSFGTRFIAFWVKAFVNSPGLISKISIVMWRRSRMGMKGSLAIGCKMVIIIFFMARDLSISRWRVQ